MGALNLDAIEFRANAATPGPWWDDENCVRDQHRRWLFEPSREVTSDDEFHEEPYANSVFVAQARSDVPALVARVRELEARVAVLLPWAAFGVGQAGYEHYCQDHGDDGCSDLRNSYDLSARIEAGEFGEFREVRP